MMIRGDIRNSVRKGKVPVSWSLHSLYPGDPPADVTLYSLYSGDPPVDVTRSGLKKKAAKKKRRPRPNLNPNFAKGKKGASNSVDTKPEGAADSKQPRAPPKPTGGGSDTTVSESNALAAVGELDIDNWENNPDREDNGHLFALTNDKGNLNPNPDLVRPYEWQKWCYFEF